MNDRAAVRMFTRPFYYLRHGETEANAARTIAGSLDVDLTALGREQARAAAQALVAEPITAIYTSPLKRARETAEPIAEALGLPLNVIDEIAERNWGELEGQPRGMRKRGMTPAGGETPQAFMARVLKGLARVEGEAPLIVAHSGIYRVLCRTLHLDEPEAPVTNAQPLYVTPLESGGWKVEPV